MDHHVKKKKSQTQIQMSHNFSHKWKSILYGYVCVHIKHMHDKKGSENKKITSQIKEE